MVYIFWGSYRKKMHFRSKNKVNCKKEHAKKLVSLLKKHLQEFQTQIELTVKKLKLQKSLQEPKNQITCL